MALRVGFLSLSVPAIVTSYSLALPSTVGSVGQFLTTDGVSTASWTTPPLATSLINGYLSSALYTIISNYSQNNVAFSLAQRTSNGSLNVTNMILNSNSQTITFQAPVSLPSTYSLTWPSTQGLGFLTNDGSGDLSWTTTTFGTNIQNVSGLTMPAVHLNICPIRSCPLLW